MEKEGERRQRRRESERDGVRPPVLPNGNPFGKRPILRGSCECARCTREASIFLGGKICTPLSRFLFFTYSPSLPFLDK